MRYSESHEWVKVEKTFGRIGISHFAQRELGDIVYIELPEVGKKLSRGEELAVIESTKAATDIYTPVSGRVVKVNEEIKKNPLLINRAPEKEGWLVELELLEPEEIGALLTEEEYAQMTDQGGYAEYTQKT